MPSATGGVIDRSVGHSAFRKLPTVPQPTSADFVPQITFRIPHFRKLPTPLYRVGQKSKLWHFVHIFTKYWSIFTIFSPVDSVGNFLLSGMHITLIMSLHYLVKYKCPKTYNIYRRTDDPKHILPVGLDPQCLVSTTANQQDRPFTQIQMI